VLLANGDLVPFDKLDKFVPRRARVLAGTGLTVGAFFNKGGEVLFQDGALVRFDKSGAHVLGKLC